MANVELFSNIFYKYHEFTNTEKKVADYILEHKEQVVYMSITDLADACKVGESSVFRFCKALGFKGYQEFKIAIAHSIALKDETPQLSDEITMQDTLEDVANKILTSTNNALIETSSLNNFHNISHVIDLLIEAKQIHFFGVGASLMTAMEAHNKFMRITNKTVCTFDSHLQIMSASLMSKDDVAILISYSGSTKDMIELAKVIREKKARIIVLTRFAKSPLVGYSDIKLLCGADEGPLQGGSLTAKISMLFLLDLLYAEYFKRTNNTSIINKEATAKAVIEKMV